MNKGKDDTVRREEIVKENRRGHGRTLGFRVQKLVEATQGGTSRQQQCTGARRADARATARAESTTQSSIPRREVTIMIDQINNLLQD